MGSASFQNIETLTDHPAFRGQLAFEFLARPTQRKKRVRRAASRPAPAATIRPIPEPTIEQLEAPFIGGRCHKQAWVLMLLPRQVAPPEPVVASRIIQSRSTLTPLMMTLEKALAAIATRGDAVPNNPGLGERIGGLRRQSVDRALHGLVLAGRVSIELTNKSRRVFVVCVGKFTGWGSARKGHPPFTTRPRGTAPKEKPIVVRLKPPPVQPIQWTALDCCQWPIGEGRAMRMCDAAITTRRASYCDEHIARSRGATLQAA